MGLRGTTPTPTAILKRRGSRQLELRRDEPEAIPEVPQAPKWLKGTAKQLWGEVIRDLQDLGVLSRSDGASVARYCAFRSQWERLYARVEADVEKMLAKDIDRYQWLSEAMLRLEREFGLTPSARVRLAKPERTPKRGTELFKAG